MQTKEYTCTWNSACSKSIPKFTKFPLQLNSFLPQVHYKILIYAFNLHVRTEFVFIFSKWVWPDYATITDCRPTYGTARKTIEVWQTTLSFPQQGHKVPYQKTGSQHKRLVTLFFEWVCMLLLVDHFSWLVLFPSFTLSFSTGAGVFVETVGRFTLLDQTGQTVKTSISNIFKRTSMWFFPQMKCVYRSLDSEKAYGNKTIKGLNSIQLLWSRA